MVKRKKTRETKPKRVMVRGSGMDYWKDDADATPPPSPHKPDHPASREEWKLIPTDATSEMAQAWEKAYGEAPEGSGHALAWEDAYQAMLVAAPVPPAAPSPSVEIEKHLLTIEEALGSVDGTEDPNGDIWDLPKAFEALDAIRSLLTAWR